MSSEPTLSTIPLVSTRHAACSCGQLRLTVEGEPVRVSICHCLACQRRTGSVFGVQARFRRSTGNDRGRLAAVHPRLRRGRETRLLPLLSGLRCDRVLHHGGRAWNCGRPGGRVRGSFLPCADEVGLGGAATFVAATSRRHRTRELTGGDGTRLQQPTTEGRTEWWGCVQALM